MSMGEMLFYGGIAGMAVVVVVVASVTLALMRRTRKRVKSQLDEEFGDEG